MRRIVVWVGLVLLVLCGAIYLAFRLSPWPGVLVIQYAFSQGDAASEARLEKHIPPGIVTRANLPYGDGADEIFDLNLPPAATRPPVIVWVHGGAWIAGTKEGIANYLKVLAGRGYATVGVEYSTGYGSTYPRPVRQVNAALAYLAAHADELGVDASRIILAGDSAGAQIAAQVSLILTDSDYARRIDIAPGLDPARLRGAILVSGGYDLKSSALESSWFVTTVLWAYSGIKDFLENGQFDLASVQAYVSPAFPPAYITSGNGDPLEPQARRLAARLEALDVPVSTLFFPADHQPPLPHEYQFNLDIEEGQLSLERMTAFIDRVLAD